MPFWAEVLSPFVNRSGLVADYASEGAYAWLDAVLFLQLMRWFVIGVVGLLIECWCIVLLVSCVQVCFLCGWVDRWAGGTGEAAVVEMQRGGGE